MDFQEHWRCSTELLLVLKVRTKQRLRLTNELADLPEVDSVTLNEQTGEVSF